MFRAILRLLGVGPAGRPVLPQKPLPLSEEIAYLFDGDQGERTGKYPLGMKNDQLRLNRLLEILRTRGFPPRDPVFPQLIDYYHAAMILQHGGQAILSRQARDLLEFARKRGAQDKDTLWLYAAATDRALMLEGKPQKYGTQFDEKGNLWSVDPSTTDEERRAFGVQPLRLASLMKKLKDFFLESVGELEKKKNREITGNRLKTVLVQRIETMNGIEQQVSVLPATIPREFLEAQKPTISAVTLFINQIKTILTQELSAVDNETQLQELFRLEGDIYSVAKQKLQQ